MKKQQEKDRWEVYSIGPEYPENIRLLREEVLLPKGSNSYDAKRQWWIVMHKKYPVPPETRLTDLLPNLRAHNLTSDGRSRNGRRFLFS